MSAICGIFALRSAPPQAAALESMLAALTHRGPDGMGHWTDGPIALGQQWLHSGPPAERQQQLWRDTTADLAVVADARLDRRADLGRALGIRAAALAQLSDSHLLGQAYRRWGPACVEHLQGDFAFALWDGRSHTLLCACDPLGMRPLYYYRDAAHFVFATEIKALLTHPAVPIRLNARKLAALAVPGALFLDKETTYYDRIFRVLGANLLTVHSGTVVPKTYWQLDPQARLRIKPEEVFEGVRARLFQIVQDHLRGPLPICALLSGGLDSSALVAVAAHVLKAQNRTLTTLSAVLPAGSAPDTADEKPFIDAFRQWDHITRVYITDPWRGPFDDLERLVWGGEKPGYTSRHYQYSAFARAVRQQQGRLLLDGSGGELGPSVHDDGFYPELLLKGRWPTLMRELHCRARREKKALWPTARSRLIRPALPSWLLRLPGRATTRFEPVHRRTHHPLQPAFVKAALDGEERRLRDRAAAVGQIFCSHRRNQHHCISLAQTHGSGTGFVGYEQIETRLPLMNPDLVQFCLAAPTGTKVYNGYTRYLIRRSLDGVLPPAIQWRTSKEPFAPDYHHRYNRQRPRVQALLAAIGPRDPIRQIVNVDQLASLSAVDMQTNRGGSATDFAALHLVPQGIYLIHFLRQFSEFSG